MRVLGWLFLVVVYLPLLYLWWGWGVSVLWGWFVVPVGLAPIGAWHGAGLRLVWSIFSIRYRDLEGDDRTTEETVIRGVAFSLVVVPFLLGLGWLFQWLAP